MNFNTALAVTGDAGLATAISNRWVLRFPTKEAAQAALQILMRAESDKQGRSAIPPGWTIRRKDRKPFKTIELSVEAVPGARYSTYVSSHEMNPANILYMLADALLEADASALTGTIEPPKS